MIRFLKHKVAGVAGRLRGNRDGATAVEAAICFPIVLGMFFAAFEYGIFFYNTFNMNKSMDESMRDIQLMEDPDAQSIRTHLNDEMPETNRGFVFFHVAKVQQYEHEFARIWMVYYYPLNIPFVKDKYVVSRYRNMLVLGDIVEEEEAEVEGA